MLENLKETISKTSKSNIHNEIFNRYLNTSTSISDDELERAYIRVQTKINNSKRVSLNFFIRIAAMIVVFFSVYVSYDTYTNPFSYIACIGDNICHVDNGDMRILLLIDGSKIWVNADSEIRYFNDNKSNTRDVYLKGEAYFEVSRDESKPFIIHMDNSSVRVLGTKFNINSYDKNNIITSIVSGKVRYSNNKENIILTANTKGYVGANGNLVKSVCVASDDTAWKMGKLIFNNHSLSDIAKELERRFNIRIEVDKSISNKSITASFENESIMEILKIMSYTNEFRFRINAEDTYIIY